MSSRPNVAHSTMPPTRPISRRSIQPASGAGGLCCSRSSGGAKSAGSAPTSLSRSLIASAQLQRALEWLADEVELGLEAVIRCRHDALRGLVVEAGQIAVQAVVVGQIATDGLVATAEVVLRQGVRQR